MTLVQSGAGQQIMDQLREVAESLRTQQNLQLETRREQWVAAATNSNLYSGAGSLVAWALGITDLDPLPYDLLFERFLNPERVSMPDFDIDFCQANRDRVIDYVKANSNKCEQQAIDYLDQNCPSWRHGVAPAAGVVEVADTGDQDE